MRWFRVLSMLMFVRYNYGHYRNTHPGIADEDPLMAQQIDTLATLVRTVSEDGVANVAHELDHLGLLFDPFTEP